MYSIVLFNISCSTCLKNMCSYVQVFLYILNIITHILHLLHTYYINYTHYIYYTHITDIFQTYYINYTHITLITDITCITCCLIYCVSSVKVPQCKSTLINTLSVGSTKTKNRFESFKRLHCDQRSMLSSARRPITDHPDRAEL